jgi:hypothetical protein
MKKTLATIITVGALVASSYAQGTVNFANAAASVVKQWTTLTDSTLINVPAAGGRVELLWAAVGTTDLSAFSSINATAGFIAPGRFSGGTVTVPVTVAGSGAAFVVRGWTGSSLTWAGINPVTDQTGVSSIFTLAATGNPTTVPPGTPASINPAFTGLTLAPPVPEPSSMVLAGLGAASLLLFRRRK